jgi:enterochelin esterase-like enzyme
MGEVHVHKVKSKQLGNERRIYVYTPPGFQKSAGPYPLLVLFDGKDYFSKIPTATILDNLIAQKRLPPTIAVSIDPVDRWHELGIGQPFIDVVARDIVPWVQTRYRATADPRATVVGGLSLGGLAAVYAAFRHPEVFGNVLSQSGSFWWFKDGDDEYEWLTRQIAASPRRAICFYLEVGLLEGARPGAPSMVLANRHLRDVLIAKGYSVTYRPFAGGHDSICWRGTFGDAVVLLLGGAHPAGARPAQPSHDLSVEDVGESLLAAAMRAAALDGGEAGLRLFRESREQPARYDIDEGGVNVLGYELLYSVAAPQAAVRVFEDNVKHFPKSANVYDSLGEALYVTGDRAGARQNYKRSLELDPKNSNAVEMLKQLSQP